MPPPDSFRDRFRGMIFGQALGDAVGLPYEFKFRADDIDVEFPYRESTRGWPAYGRSP